jgi:hypothetical protein
MSAFDPKRTFSPAKNRVGFANRLTQNVCANGNAARSLIHDASREVRL